MLFIGGNRVIEFGSIFMLLIAISRIYNLIRIINKITKV
jgi:hypothetical protein